MNHLKEREEFEKYRKIKLLGEGSFGKAYLIERVSDKLMCVMKTIDIGRLSESEKRETLQEAKIIESLSHSNIVKFIEVFKTKRGKLCIVMDYADGGDLGLKIKRLNTLETGDLKNDYDIRKRRLLLVQTSGQYGKKAFFRIHI